MRIVILFTILFLNSYVFAQQFTVSGTVSDVATGEVIIGVYISSQDGEYGSVTNVYGFYSLTLPKGKNIIEYSIIGHSTLRKEINLQNNININIELEESDTQIGEVTIFGEKADKNIKNIETGVSNLNPREIKIIPVIFGEQDILKTIQLLPGIKPSGEGGSGFHVRGGGADENLILLDEAPVYNASHLMGFFSVFNSDAVKNAKIYKGTAPAQYGGRLSSVLDIQMKEGNMKQFSASGGIGLISSRLTIESPIVKNKASFIISGRRTYADLFLVFAPREEQRNSTLYFYDLNAKVNYKINDNNRLFLSGYFGRDVFAFDDIMEMDWGNTTGTLRWNHIFNSKLFLNSTVIRSKYDYQLGFCFFDEDGGVIRLKSAIEDWNIKEDFQYYLNSKNLIRFGINSMYHKFLPGEVDASEVEEINDIKVQNKYAFENVAYISHEVSLLKNLKAVYGFRLSAFCVLGPGTVYEFNDREEPIDSVSYGNNDIIKTYKNFEPRISLNYIIDKQNAVKASYTKNTQYIHLLSNSTSSTPMDLWYPTTKIIKPGLANLYSVGYYRNFNDNMFETSIELYYKDLKDVIDYRNGANVMINEYLEAELLLGKGWSYGAEIYIKKQMGDITGWISYTWSKTERIFDEINNGLAFSARHDRTHDFSITGMYAFNKRLSFAATWVYYTGDAVTFPTGRYIVDGRIISLYTERNGYRLPNYHRMDFSVTYKNKERKRWESDWNLSIYNVYAKKNAYQITFRQVSENSTQFEAVRLALFSIIPSISYNFRFN
ncbi:MAG: TonB-dependent receptor [Bacteroidales bacterium]|nr:TonB-dependent receptor [Bacteroidales bacterium]